MEKQKKGQQKRKGSKKQKSKKSKGKSKALALTETETFVLDIWKVMDKNPLYKNLSKPTKEYIEYALSDQPNLKKMAVIERREHLLNLVILAWCRDSIFESIDGFKDRQGIDWTDVVEPKVMRLLKDIIKEHEKILPKIFIDVSSEYGSRQAGKKIRRTLIEETVEFGDNEPTGGDTVVLKEGEFQVKDVDPEDDTSS